MSDTIQLHDVVALLEDTLTTHFATGQPLRLRRGQIGTVVMLYDGTAYEVEFADSDGRAYAMMAIRADKLMVLHDSPEEAAAESGNSSLAAFDFLNTGGVSLPAACHPPGLCGSEEGRMQCAKGTCPAADSGRHKHG